MVNIPLFIGFYIIIPGGAGFPPSTVVKSLIFLGGWVGCCMTTCFCWTCVCNPETGGCCKKKISKGGDKDAQINAKRVLPTFAKW